MSDPDDAPEGDAYKIGDPPYWQEPYLDDNGYRAWLTTAMADR